MPFNTLTCLSIFILDAKIKLNKFRPDYLKKKLQLYKSEFVCFRIYYSISLQNFKNRVSYYSLNTFSLIKLVSYPSIVAHRSSIDFVKSSIL